MKSLLSSLAVFSLALVGLFSGITIAHASSGPALPIAAPSPSRIVDTGEMLTSAQITALNENIAAHQKKYGLLFFIETLPSLKGQTLETIALARAKNLAVGDADKNHAVLIFLSRDDRKIRFELGNGVSEKVSDSEMKRIIDSNVTPSFKTGDYTSGITSGMTAVGDRYISTAPANNNESEDYMTGTYIILGIILGILVIVFIWREIWSEEAKRRRRLDMEYWEMKQAIARLEKINKYTSTLKYSEDADRYKALKNTAERLDYLVANYPDLVAILRKHHSSENIPPTRIVDRTFYDDTHGISIGFTAKSTTPSSLRNFYLTGKGFENMSIDEANNIIRSEKAKTEKAKEKERKKRERARKIWDAIPAPTQKALVKAKSQSSRLALLGNDVSNDFAANYSVIASMFLSSSSSNSSGHSGSSGSSGSSSSSSGGYSSGGDSGGSFDGSGGSGSW